MSIAYSFPKEHKEHSDEGRRSYSPSPDAYDPDRAMRIVKEQSPEWSFARSGRPDQQPGGPGPGYYEADQTKLRMNVSYSMGSKALSPNYTPAKTSRDPGPGAYDPTLQSKPPTYTMGGKYRDMTTLQTPGPGAYELDASQNSMRNSQRQGVSPFGSKQKRDTSAMHYQSKSQIMFSPGPGAYSPKHGAVKAKNPTAKISKGMKGITSKDLSPGPGAYEALSKEIGKQSQRVTMSGRPQTAKLNHTPGPGQYQSSHKTINDNSKSQRGIASMKNTTSRMSGHMSKDQMMSPGPGAYDANVHAIKDKVRTTGFGKTQRGNFVGKDEKLKPGPGNYDVNDTKSAKSFKIGQRISSAIKNNTPGPGNYEPNVNVVKDSTRNVKISNSQQKSTMYHSKSTHEIPGPGSYYNGNEFGKNAQAFSIRGKPNDNQRNDSPGPGQYDPRDMLSKERIQSATMMSQSKRQEFYQTIQHPGPGSYSDANQDFGKNAKSFTIRGKPADANDCRSPGPGAYDANHQSVKETVRTYQMGTSKRTEITAKTAREQPGPGAYDQHKNFGQGAPQYSMKSKREELRRDNVPGPGAYNATESVIRDKSPSYRMAQTTRTEIVSKEAIYSPGPGNYDQSSTIGKGGPKYTFQPKPDNSIKDRNPGPGNYEPNKDYVKDKVVSYQMGSSQRTKIISKDSSALPGPGNYGSPSKQGYEGPKYTMGARSKSRQELSPGPGQYDPSDNVIKDNARSFGMNKSVRVDIVSKSQLEHPGPGAYSNANEFGKDSKSFQIRGKPQEKVGNGVPGPGNYEANSNMTKDRVITHKISQSQRTEIVTKEMIYQPGPGEYDSPKRFGEGAQSVTIRGRPNDNNRNDSPGPGMYDPDHAVVKDKAVSYKMSSSHRTQIVSKQQQELPGPGIYEQHSSIGKNVSYTIGGKAKEVQDTKIPGPGSYDPKDYLTKDQTSNSFKMAQSHRTQIVSKEEFAKPGPGNYEEHNNFGKDAKSFQIRGKPQDKAANDVPGPGNYEANSNMVKDRVVSYRMGITTRTDIVAKERALSPGPGAYESPQKKTGPNYTMGARNDSPSRSNIPGPGQYDANESLTKYKSPGYKMETMSKRTEIVSREQYSMPGPGNYDDHNTFGKDAKSFQIRGKPQDLQADDVPGPGNYEASQHIVKDRVVSYKMGTTTRKGMVSSERAMSPGPGQYDQSTRQTGPNYTMGARNDSPSRSNVPGPGEYDPNESITKYASPSFKMDAKSKRTDIVSKESYSMPGPGNYHDAKQFGQDAKSFQIRSRPQDLQADDVPGPGNYEANSNVVKDRVVTYKMSSSTRQNIVSSERAMSPGPGQYDQANKQTGPNYTMGTRNDSPSRNNVPGPGEYDPNESVTKYASPSFKMDAKSKRTDIVSKESYSMPGPGNYHDTKQFGQDAKSFQIRGRPQDIHADDVPGPGNYDGNANVVKERVVAYKMSSSVRQEIVTKESYQQPGPGQYDQHSRSSGPNYTIGGRTDSPGRNNIPGPGHYDPNESVTKHQAASFKIDNQTKRVDIVSKESYTMPGPGNYHDAKQFGQDAKSFQIRSRPQDIQADDVPGPGNYDGNANVVKERVVAYKMSSSTRQNIVSSERAMSPGPGQYDSPSKNTGPNYTIGGRVDSPPRNNVPGPGEYDLNDSITKYASPSYKIDNSTKRTNLVSKEQMSNPGPGNYTEGKNFGADARSFQIRGKPQDLSKNENPGPGNYEPILDQTKDKVVVYKMGKESRQSLVSRERQLSPGPGQYDQHQQNSGPNYTIGERNDSPPRNNVPGPGHYDPNESVTKHQAASFKIDSQTKRVDIVSKEQYTMPGPGIYDQASSIGKGPAVSIRGRPSPERDSSIPGPGSYDGNVNAVKDNSSASFRMGTNKRDFLTTSQEGMSQPGPGFYDVKGGPAGPSFSIRGRESGRNKNDIPGPGTYEAVDNDMLRHHNPPHDFSRSPDRSYSPQREDMPGPGQYYDNRDYNLAGHTSVSYTIPKNEKQEPLSDTPGPGHYKIPVKFADVPNYNQTNQSDEFKWI